MNTNTEEIVTASPSLAYPFKFKSKGVVFEASRTDVDFVLITNLTGG